jgi:hypothetical protein
MAAQAETAYRTMIAAWQPTRPTKAATPKKVAVGVDASNRDATVKPSG